MHREAVPVQRFSSTLVGHMPNYRSNQNQPIWSLVVAGGRKTRKRSQSEGRDGGPARSCPSPRSDQINN